MIMDTMSKVNWIAIGAAFIPVALLWCPYVLLDFDIHNPPNILIALAFAGVLTFVVAAAFARTTVFAFVFAGTIAFAIAVVAALAGAVALASGSAFAAIFAGALALGSAGAFAKKLSFWWVVSRFFFSALAIVGSVYVILSSVTLFSIPLWITSFLPILFMSLLVWLLPTGSMPQENKT